MNVYECSTDGKDKCPYFRKVTRTGRWPLVISIVGIVITLALTKADGVGWFTPLFMFSASQVVDKTAEKSFYVNSGKFIKGFAKSSFVYTLICACGCLLGMAGVLVIGNDAIFFPSVGVFDGFELCSSRSFAIAIVGILGLDIFFGLVRAMTAAWGHRIKDKNKLEQEEHIDHDKQTGLMG